ncbi:SET and MYND domain-containing protein 5 [Agrilus planipennis]|uniref:SET and MYND domain-containing protein 5 n=1 Tax=Agrilus planipennis TaxID=224129 RepID=A0A1W4WVI3_AGRPL|nr:SET and MYND domain-containing protein 5 [Agrilus planipennis]
MNVEIREIDCIKGKGLFAKKFLPTGSVILEEEPLVCCQFSWNAACNYKACDHCLRPLESAQENARRLAGNYNLVLPHPECCTTNKTAICECASCGTEYCSQDCLVTAFNQYHRTLCLQTKERNGFHPLETLNEAWKQIHHPPETSTIMILPRLIATIEQAENPDEMLKRILNFTHRTRNEDLELVHKIMGDKYVDSLNTLYNLLLAAVPHDVVGPLLTLEGFYSMLALLGTNGQGVGTSPISQWVTKASELPLSKGEKKRLDQFIDKLYEDMDKHSGNFLNNEGVALFSMQSSANHSCDPNAEPNYLHNNSRLSLVALKDIQEGDEICISYLDECNLSRSRHSRHKMLKENYLFVCCCPKCKEQVEDPDVTSSEEEEEDHDDDDDGEDMSE